MFLAAALQPVATSTVATCLCVRMAKHSELEDDALCQVADEAEATYNDSQQESTVIQHLPDERPVLENLGPQAISAAESAAEENDMMADLIGIYRGNNDCADDCFVSECLSETAIHSVSPEVIGIDGDSDYEHVDMNSYGTVDVGRNVCSNSSEASIPVCFNEDISEEELTVQNLPCCSSHAIANNDSCTEDHSQMTKTDCLPDPHIAVEEPEHAENSTVSRQVEDTATAKLSVVNGKLDSEDSWDDSLDKNLTAVLRSADTVEQARDSSVANQVENDANAIADEKLDCEDSWNDSLDKNLTAVLCSADTVEHARDSSAVSHVENATNTKLADVDEQLDSEDSLNILLFEKLTEDHSYGAAHAFNGLDPDSSKSAGSLADCPSAQLALDKKPPQLSLSKFDCLTDRNIEVEESEQAVGSFIACKAENAANMELVDVDEKLDCEDSLDDDLFPLCSIDTVVQSVDRSVASQAENAVNPELSFADEKMDCEDSLDDSFDKQLTTDCLFQTAAAHAFIDAVQGSFKCAENLLENCQSVELQVDKKPSRVNAKQLDSEDSLCDLFDEELTSADTGATHDFSNLDPASVKSAEDPTENCQMPEPATDKKPPHIIFSPDEKLNAERSAAAANDPVPGSSESTDNPECQPAEPALDKKPPHLDFSPDVLLVAPTGKAANVLGRRTGVQAFTMHQVIFSYTQTPI